MSDFEELTKTFDLFKIAIMGDPGVGKTSFFNKFIDRTDNRCNPVTIWVDSEFKSVYGDEKAIELQISDSADFCKSLTAIEPSKKSRIAHGIIIMYDCTNYKSFENLTYWVDAAKHNFWDAVPKLLVGNKCDLSHGSIDYTIAKKYADQLQMPFLETSAKDGINVKLAFETMIFHVYNKQLESVQQEGEHKDQHEKDQKLLLQPSVTVATEMKTQVDWTPGEESETEAICELEKFICGGKTADITKRWKKWKKAFELYLMARDITDDQRKKATLLHCAGPDVQDIYFTLVEQNHSTEAAGPSQSAETMEYETAMSLIDNYFLFEKKSARKTYLSYNATEVQKDRSPIRYQTQTTGTAVGFWKDVERKRRRSNYSNV